MRKSMRRKEKTASTSTPTKSVKDVMSKSANSTDDEDEEFKPYLGPDPIDEFLDRLDAGFLEKYVYPQKDYSEDYRHQNLKCANIALEYYNKKNHTNYELVEAISSCGFLYPPLWIHCNFTAKPKTNFDGVGDSSTKLFFAELRREAAFHYVVSACRIFKGKSYSCDFCENDKVKHPSHGFRMRYKHWLHQPYDLRSRSRT